MLNLRNNGSNMLVIIGCQDTGIPLGNYSLTVFEVMYSGQERVLVMRWSFMKQTGNCGHLCMMVWNALKLLCVPELGKCLLLKIPLPTLISGDFVKRLIIKDGWKRLIDVSLVQGKATSQLSIIKRNMMVVILFGYWLKYSISQISHVPMKVYLFLIRGSSLKS